MNALTITTNTSLANFSQEAVARALEFQRNQVAPSTLRAYESDWKVFEAFCESHGVSAKPAAPQTVVLFLAHQAELGKKTATLGRRVAAINFVHLAANYESPTSSSLVKGQLKGIRRTVGAAPTKKTPITSAKLKEMVRLCPNTLQGKRDKALLLLGFGGAFRRSELVRIQVADIQEDAGGVRITVRKSKTDQEGLGQQVPVVRGEVFCPVKALQDYLAAAGITEGYVFRAVTKYDTLRKEALSTKSVADIVKDYATSAGFDAAEFAGHSLRSGFLTSAAEAGANVFKMIEVSRHRSLETVRGYVRSAEMFKNHAGAGLL